MSGSEPASAAATWSRALRWPFLSASLLPYLYGAALAAGPVRWLPLVLGLAMVGCSHLAANLVNDLADAEAGADAVDLRYWRLFGGSKLLQTGRLSRRAYRAAGAGFGAAAAALAAASAAVVGRPDVLLYFAVVAALAWMYSARPARLAYRGLGELTVAGLFGPAAVVGGAFLQRGGWPGGEAAALSLAPGLLTAALLAANEVPDAADDAAAGKRTLVVRVGGRRGWMVFAGFAAGAYAVIAAGLALGRLGPAAWATLAGLPVAAATALVLGRRAGDKRGLLLSSKLAIALQAGVTAILLVDAWLRNA
jgi:1,4-dihydroxy-2-naphthoate octaprenyltransferase